MNADKRVWIKAMWGQQFALGMAWHLDSGFWDIFIDCALGWIYVGYKIAQLIFTSGG